VAYAGSRTQFGVPIGSFQAVQHQLADVLLAVEQARVAAWYAALRLRDGETDAVRAASIAKLAANAASQAADRVALQVHGGIGFTWEHDLHLLCKRAASWRAADGDARTHRELVATHLLGTTESTRTETV
jgi:alkylation response protein AidB-like acyl-CoA dehydrogenase